MKFHLFVSGLRRRRDSPVPQLEYTVKVPPLISLGPDCPTRVAPGRPHTAGPAAAHGTPCSVELRGCPPAKRCHAQTHHNGAPSSPCDGGRIFRRTSNTVPTSSHHGPVTVGRHARVSGWGGIGRDRVTPTREYRSCLPPAMKPSASPIARSGRRRVSGLCRW